MCYTINTARVKTWNENMGSHDGSGSPDLLTETPLLTGVVWFKAKPTGRKEGQLSSAYTSRTGI